MKKYIKIELDISDEFIKNWNNDFLQHHFSLYKNEEKAEEALKSNPFEKSLAEEIEEYINNYYGSAVKCNAEILKLS